MTQHPRHASLSGSMASRGRPFFVGTLPSLMLRAGRHLSPLVTILSSHQKIARACPHDARLFHATRAISWPASRLVLWHCGAADRRGSWPCCVTRAVPAQREVDKCRASDAWRCIQSGGSLLQAGLMDGWISGLANRHNFAVVVNQWLPRTASHVLLLPGCCSCSCLSLHGGAPSRGRLLRR